MGFVRPSADRSTAESELNGSPVLLTPSRSRAVVRADQLAHQREHERLRDAHDRELVVGVPGRKRRARGSDHAHAEEVGGNAGQRGICLRVLAVAVCPIAVMGLAHQALHEGALRQLPGRDEGVASGTIDCTRHINPPARDSTNAPLPDAGPDARTTAVPVRPGGVVDQPTARASRTRLTVAPGRTCAPGASCATRTSSISHIASLRPAA